MSRLMFPRFSLATLLMLTMIIAASANLAFAFYRESKPIKWEEFTYAKAEQVQRDGKTVLFFGNPTYAVESQIVRQKLDNSRIATATHRGAIVPLIRTYDDWDDPEMHAVWKRFGHTKYPMVLLFSPDCDVAQANSLDIESIERRIGSSSPIPAIPSLGLVSAMLVCCFARWYTDKRQNNALHRSRGVAVS